MLVQMRLCTGLIQHFVLEGCQPFLQTTRAAAQHVSDGSYGYMYSIHRTCVLPSYPITCQNGASGRGNFRSPQRQTARITGCQDSENHTLPSQPPLLGNSCSQYVRINTNQPNTACGPTIVSVPPVLPVLPVSLLILSSLPLLPLSSLFSLSPSRLRILASQITTCVTFTASC